MRAQVESLSGLQFNDFLLHLWQELTIAGRAIWSDERLDQGTQLHALKWLNEIQHRVSGAYRREDQAASSWLLDRIASHCNECPALGFHVRVALDRSLAAVVSAKAQVPEMPW